MSQQGGLRRSLKLATALLVTTVALLVMAGIAQANNITVSNTAQLQNVLSSPPPVRRLRHRTSVPTPPLGR
jgi:hypothetical protein